MNIIWCYQLKLNSFVDYHFIFRIHEINHHTMASTAHLMKLFHDLLWYGFLNINWIFQGFIWEYMMHCHYIEFDSSNKYLVSINLQKITPKCFYAVWLLLTTKSRLVHQRYIDICFRNYHERYVWSTVFIANTQYVLKFLNQNILF